MLSFQLASTADIDAVMQIITRAKRRLAEAGVDQWQQGYPNADSIRADIAARVGFVLRSGGEIAAYAAIITGDEPTYARVDGEGWAARGLYTTVHRIAAALPRSGAGREMLAQAVRIARERGCAALRADTHALNAPMNALLLSFGFSRRGVIYLPDGSPREAYELLLSE